MRTVVHRRVIPSLALVLWLCSLNSHTSTVLGANDENIAPQDAYKVLAEKVSKLIESEMGDKNLPALSIALVDGDRIVWAQGFGFADPAKTRPATAATIYRVGSISKLLTDIAVMQLVNQDKLDLDAPVTQYLPDFRPHNSFNREITLRQLMSHRAGLVREPPVGNYFDPNEPSLAETVQSLNETSLVYEPETKTKYSNAGIGVVGYVVEQTVKQPFVDYMDQNLFQRMDLHSTSFRPKEDMKEHLAQGWMWTYDGRMFEAPHFLLGTSAAGNLYSSVTDLARLQIALLNASDAADAKPLPRHVLDQMWKPQFATDATSGFGLGFHVSQFERRRRIGHGGAVYGHATRFAALPDDRLGVVVAIARDCANGVADRIGDYTLSAALAVREARELPDFELTQSIPAERAQKLVGHYVADDQDSIEIARRGERVFLWRSERKVELRSLDDHFVGDDVQGRGARVNLLDADKVKVEDRTYVRQAEQRPDPPPPHWRGLIGEYGWDHNTLYILEERGRLYALIEWFFFYPLTEVDENTFRFPSSGLYQDESLIFERDASGDATSVVAANVKFVRRAVGTKHGDTFRIVPAQPVDKLRAVALSATPPHEEGDFLKPELVEPSRLEPAIKLDIRYATTNNFMGAVFYPEPRAFLQRPAAEALVRVHQQLKPHGYGLLIHDAYRPWFVTKMFYDATPEDQKIFVANPANGSRHNRGAAVDLTLYDLSSGAAVEMPSGYDEFTARAYPDYPGGSSLERWQRELLRRSMEAEHFTVYEFEWWHFDYANWRQYPILNLRFDEIR